MESWKEIKMNKATEVYKDALICPICMETLIAPKILPCGHSFCLTPCLEEIVKRYNPICPLCRKSIVLPPSGDIADLATNYSVTGLLEMLKEREDKEEMSPAISSHTKEVGDYVCITCVEQVCSCCQLLSHIESDHNCTSVLEFTEKVRQDVSKIVAAIDESSWPIYNEHYANTSSVATTYLGLKENINSACNEVFQELSKENLDLTKMTLLQRQAKEDQLKFDEARETLTRESREAERNAKLMVEQLADYRQKLMKLSLPKSVYKNPWRDFKLKVASFESLKSTTEALTESLAQEFEQGPFRNVVMRGKLHDVGENLKVLEEYFKDIRQDYHRFLLKKVGINNYIVESHHLFRVLETVNVMNFGSDRHSKEIMLKCNNLVFKFLASRDFIRESCEKIYEEFPNELLPPPVVQERFVEILKEMENCKACYEDIYKVIGTNSVEYGKGFAERFLRTYLSTLKKYDLDNPTNNRAQVVTKHLAEFESYKEITRAHCVDLNRHLLEEDLDASVVHRKLKEIEIRFEKIEHHYQLLQSISFTEKRCHEIVEEFERLNLTEQTMTAQIKECCKHKEQVMRLWRLILRQDPKNVSFDDKVITGIAKAMEERRNDVVALFVLSDLEINELCRTLSKLNELVDLSARLHRELKEISSNGKDLSNFYRGELKGLHLISELSYIDPGTKSSCVRKYSLQKLLVFTNQGNRLNELSKTIHRHFATECWCAFDIEVSKYKVMYDCFQQLFELLEVYHLNQKIRTHWGKVTDIVNTENFDFRKLKNYIDESLSLKKKVEWEWLLLVIFFFISCILIGLLALVIVLYVHV